MVQFTVLPGHSWSRRRVMIAKGQELPEIRRLHSSVYSRFRLGTRGLHRCSSIAPDSLKNSARQRSRARIPGVGGWVLTLVFGNWFEQSDDIGALALARRFGQRRRRIDGGKRVSKISSKLILGCRLFFEPLPFLRVTDSIADIREAVPFGRLLFWALGEVED